MLIYDNKAFDEESRNNYIALGSFDGLHLGHLSLVRKVKNLAAKNGGKSVVFTFKNHPRTFININNKIELIMTNEEKIEVLQKEGSCVGPGKSNLPFELRRKAGDCSRVTAGPIDLI